MSYSIQYLGEYLVTNLTFSKHVKQKVKATMVNFVKIQSIRKNVLVSTYTTLVLMLCISHIDYANVILYGTTKKGVKQIPNPAKHVCKISIGKMKVYHKLYISYTGYLYRKGFITKLSHLHMSASMDKHRNTSKTSQKSKESTTGSCAPMKMAYY